MEKRLDAFTDATFAFAVTLLVIGGSAAPRDTAQLSAALRDIPAYAFGFAMIMTFWFGHVRWRLLRASGGAIPVLLTLMLLFVVLIYVQPLRAMAQSLSGLMFGRASGFRGGVGLMFLLFGIGTATMAALLAALFHDALRAATAATRAQARGERTIWTIIALTGLASTLVATSRYGPWAAMLYSTLPLTIGWFSWRHDWEGKQAIDHHDPGGIDRAP